MAVRVPALTWSALKAAYRPSRPTLSPDSRRHAAAVASLRQNGHGSDERETRRDFPTLSMATTHRRSRRPRAPAVQPQCHCQSQLIKRRAASPDGCPAGNDAGFRDRGPATSTRSPLFGPKPNGGQRQWCTNGHSNGTPTARRSDPPPFSAADAGLPGDQRRRLRARDCRCSGPTGSTDQRRRI